MSRIWRPSGPILQSFNFYTLNNQTTALASGTLFLASIDLPLGFPVTKLWWFSGTTALTRGTGSHYWMALLSSPSRAVLATTADDTAGALAASTLLSPSLSSPPFVTTYAGHHYVGLMVNSGTGGVQPTITVATSLAAVVGNVMVDGGKPNGTSTTALTDPASLTSPAAAIATIGGLLWVGVS